MLRQQRRGGDALRVRAAACVRMKARPPPRSVSMVWLWWCAPALALGGSPPRALLSTWLRSDDFIKTKAESIDGLEVAFERGAPPELVLMDDRERETVIRCAAASRCPRGWCRSRAWRRSRQRVPGAVLAASADGSPAPLSSSLRRNCGRSRRPHHVLEHGCTCTQAWAVQAP